MSVVTHVLRSAQIEAQITNLGGRVVSLRTPDRDGVWDDVVLGFDDLGSYRDDRHYLGALIGRYANRIAHGRLVLDGRVHELPHNDRGHTLHGGPVGFDRQTWQSELAGDALVLRHRSVDGEQGFPGNLDVTARYSLRGDELRIDYHAVSDRLTVFNPTNHVYFNLAGSRATTVLDHRLMLNASRYLPVDTTLVPTGELRNVAGSPFDFRAPHAIGERLAFADEQLGHGNGYDHTWVVNDWRAGQLALAARVEEPITGRTIEVLTTEPGVHLYSGNYLGSQVPARNGLPLGTHHGFCLETQHFPDSPNHPHFPDTRLSPGQVFTSTTIYRFEVVPDAARSCSPADR